MHTISTPINSRADSSVLLMPQNLTRQVMSSREIADLTGKQHKDVIRDVRVMQKALEEDGADLRHLTDVKDCRGYTSEFLLGRDLTETLITGYSIALRHKVIRRLRELEDQLADGPRIPTNLPDALRLAADQAEQNQKLRLVILEQAPKVDALDRLANTHGSICITDAAKHMGLPPLQLFGWLSKNRWIYRRSSYANWSAFQPRISSGVLEHKLVEIRNKDTQELKVVEQVMVTRRGLVLLAEKLTGAAL